jgi:[glutamine synthetase] adenylyltransferase / [glutamine synthetase]-adenylyl-L-tyrosine phosphorylase
MGRAMAATVETTAREDAIARARSEAPFLREAMLFRPDLVDIFINEGAEKAIARALTAKGDDLATELRRRRHGIALTVALGDLAGEFNLERVTELLSDFAEDSIDRALSCAITERVLEADPAGIAVIALGKLGSRELNYSSDVDLILLYDPATLPRRARDDAGEAAVRIGRRLIELLQQRTADGYVARVDLRLRPSPEVTPIVLPVGAAIAYYESTALPWERAAFIRARVCGGDRVLGAHFLEAIQPFIWRRTLDFGVIDEIRSISMGVRDHYAQVQAFGPGYDVKRGRGGIREVEFFTQAQQMIHGGREPGLRAPATLDALAALSAAGHLDAKLAGDLADAYRLHRTIEHRLQMIDDQQTHRLPVEPKALDAVARLYGLVDGKAFLEVLEPHVKRVGAAFDGLASGESRTLSQDPDKLRAELLALGFGEIETVMKRIAEWRSAHARSLRSPPARIAFEAMLPGLLAAVATGPDPNRALNRFSDVVERMSSGVNFYRLLEAQPALARLLAEILSHAPVLADQLARRPELLDGLIDASSFDPPPDVATLIARLKQSKRGESYDSALDRVRRSVNERRFALGVQIVARHHDPLDVAGGYSRVAEAAVDALADAAIEEFAAMHGRVKRGEFIILALGRLGGEALTHASDLDLIYLFDAPDGARSDGAKSLVATDYYNRLASRVTAALSVATAAGPLYDVDTRLRPQGAKGMLAVSLAAFAAYQQDEAWTWEHMALTRARAVFGSTEGRAKLAGILDTIVKRPRDRAKTLADAIAMRNEMAQHKPPAGPLDIKLGPGGLIDLEFAIHVLQLTRGVAFDPRLGDAIEGLIAAGLMPPGIARAHDLLTRMLVTMRLVAPGGGEIEPESRALVAEVCGHDDWEALLAAHDRARQSVAELWASVKGETT